MKTKQYSKGFTLLELLIAIALTALIATISYQFISSSLNSAQSVKNNAKRSESFQQFFYIFGQDITHLIKNPSLSLKEADNKDTKAYFLGGYKSHDNNEDFLTLTIFTKTPLLLQDKSPTTTVVYSFNNSSIQRSLLSEKNTKILSTEVIATIENIKIFFYDNEQKKQTSWSNKEETPKAIEIIISSKDYGDIRRIYAVL